MIAVTTLGDSAFFKSLNLYLTANKFRSAEAQQLRLAFEEVTGEDLNWYWNQSVRWQFNYGYSHVVDGPSPGNLHVFQVRLQLIF